MHSGIPKKQRNTISWTMEQINILYQIFAMLMLYSFLNNGKLRPVDPFSNQRTMCTTWFRVTFLCFIHERMPGARYTANVNKTIGQLLLTIDLAGQIILVEIKFRDSPRFQSQLTTILRRYFVLANHPPLWHYGNRIYLSRSYFITYVHSHATQLIGIKEIIHGRSWYRETQKYINILQHASLTFDW